MLALLLLAIEALKAQKEHSLQHPSGVIFLNPRTGEPWEGDAPIRKTLWVPTLKKPGVRYRRPYQTRHTFASMMLSAGENIAWVAKMMGHGGLSMVSRVYGKWVQDTDPQAGSKAVGIF
ncbi:tyrosine-type recombinase/integrase [Halothiobacillus sp. 15-55-196]|uniref:tyrosine-type recombinase/integrase n=1 Tax=Halothiobacillus sp. 15-55-196 TaxID=1970382 RepID=UPI0025C68AD8|nr:tyrosine-type recombinase/integrase [Halothiobacillus sp. 15-55-196]